jgi:diguanylate cyclase
MACLSIAFGQISRAVHARRVRTMIIGMLFGATSVLSSLYHASATSLVDASAIFVGFAAAFLGPPGALSALAVALPGLLLLEPNWTQVLQLLAAAITGAFWNECMRGWDRRDLKALLMLGVLQTAALLPATLWPDGNFQVVPSTFVLGTLGLNALIALLVGSFIERERIMLAGEQHLHELAHTDQLTGLHNRRTIIAAFESRSAGSEGQALLMIDVDHFKSINDAHGHAAGDQVLRHIAGQLRNCIRSSDIAGRVGGEEFAVLLTASSLEEAAAAAERLRHAIERHRVHIHQLAIPVTVSIGVTWWRGSANFQEQFQAADKALYHAKRLGRNRVASNLDWDSASATEATAPVGKCA